MGKTLKVLADRRKEIDSLVAAGEVLNLRFQPGKTILSLRAAKLLHRLIDAAGVNAGKSMTHIMPVRDLNQFHISKEEFFTCCEELFGVSVRLEMHNAKGKKMTKAGPLLADVERDEDEADGELRFELSPVLRQVMRNSNHWAVLSRDAVMAFQSRYSLRLYELVSLRIGRKLQHCETFSIDDLRSLFGVPAGKLTTWSNLRIKVIETAIAEVNHLTGLAVSYKPTKRGRSVTGIKLIWREKEQDERDAAARELNHSSVGRAARRDGKVEQAIDDGEDYVTAEEIRKLSVQLARAKRH